MEGDRRSGIPLEGRVETLENRILGKPGQPQNSLIVQVDNISKDVRSIKKGLTVVGFLVATTLIKSILELVLQ